MIKAILFDIDGVLIDSFDANLKFYQDLLVKAGYPPPTKEDFLPLFQTTMKDVIKTLTKSNSEGEIQKIWEMGKSRAVPYPMHLIRTPKNLEQIIDDLHQKYTLGIVTGRIKNGVYDIPQLKNLKQYFGIVIAYEDTTNHKPHPEPLLLAAKKLNINVQQILYIGDQDNDIQAAKAANMFVVIYSKTNYPSADACTNDFSKLPTFINQLSK